MLAGSAAADPAPLHGSSIVLQRFKESWMVLRHPDIQSFKLPCPSGELCRELRVVAQSIRATKDACILLRHLCGIFIDSSKNSLHGMAGVLSKHLRA
eukprot:1005382-Amphidinium_carterae.1